MTMQHEEAPKPRKEEILEVATRLFAERGYEGTSMNDVAEHVGMRKASLFYHFATKDSLYESVVDRIIASLHEPLEAIYASSGTFPERLDALSRTLVEALGARPYAARLLLRETMDWGPVMRGKLAERILLVLEAGAAWVRAGQADGAFVEGDPRHMVITAIGMHLLPFAIGQLVERFTGQAPFDPAFIEHRREEVLRQARNLHVKR
jgi:TetR/AcrR family transcriptional regulator